MAEKRYPSPNTLIGVGRQKGDGFYNLRKTNLFPILLTSVTPTLSGAMSSLGIEVGGGTITEQASQKESFSPMLTMNGHVRVGALMNLLVAAGYKPATTGSSLGSPVTTTVAGNQKAKHNALVVAATTGISVGDYVRVGAVPTIAVTDLTEVHKVAAVASAAADEVQTLTIYGGPTGGTFYVYDPIASYQSADLAYNISAAAFTTALEAHYGSGNVVVTGSAGGPYTISFAGGALASTQMNLLLGNGDSLTGGTGYGANAGLDGQEDSWVDVQRTTEGHAATALVFTRPLLYDHADTVAVEKLDATKGFRNYFFHVQPGDEIDRFSAYVNFTNGVQKVSLIYFDGLASRFDLSFNTGSIATFSAEMKFADVVIVDPTTVTFDVDPSPVSLNNTRGSFTYLGNHVDPPRSIQITNAAEIPDDFTLFRYKPQSIQHTGYTLSLTTESNFVKDLSNKINFNNTEQTVSDVTPQYPLTFKFLSQQKVLSTTTPYELSLVATDAQFGQYNPQISTNTLISASIGMIKVIPNNAFALPERWYYTTFSLATSDTWSSN